MSKGERLAGAIAYEELHVPALFEEWTGPVLDAANVESGQCVLDVACGTGVLARSAFRRVGETGAVTGLDPDPGMLEVAKSIEPSVVWQNGVAEALPFPDASFDAVVSQFGVMFFTDRLQAAEEMLRVLKDEGCFAVAVWDSLENSPAYAAEVALLDELAGTEAADALRAPFVLGDPVDVTDLFKAAGAEEIAVSSRTGTAEFPSVRALVGADLKGWLPLRGIELSNELIERILTEAETVLRQFVTPTGTVVFDSPAHIISGRKA